MAIWPKMDERKPDSSLSKPLSRTGHNSGDRSPINMLILIHGPADYGAPEAPSGSRDKKERVLMF